MITCGLLFVLFGCSLGLYFRALILLPVTIVSLTSVLSCGIMANLSLTGTVFGVFALAGCLQGGYIAGLSGREWFLAMAQGAGRLAKITKTLAPPVG